MSATKKKKLGYFQLKRGCLMTGSWFHGLWNNPYIWQGRISSPKNTLNDQGPFFSSLMSWWRFYDSPLKALQVLQDGSIHQPPRKYHNIWMGIWKGLVGSYSCHHLPKTGGSSTVVEVSGCQCWSRKNTQNRTNWLFKTKTICTYCKGSSTLIFQVDKRTGFTEKRLKSRNPQKFFFKQSWTSRVCIYIYIIHTCIFIYLYLFAVDGTTHGRRKKKRGHFQAMVYWPKPSRVRPYVLQPPEFPKGFFIFQGSMFSFRVNFLRVHCLPNKLLWISINWKRFLQTRTSWLVKCQLATDFPVVLGSSHIEPGASWVITVWKMMSGCIHGRRNPKKKTSVPWDFPSWAAIHSVFQKKTHQRVEKEPITLNQNHENSLERVICPKKNSPQPLRTGVFSDPITITIAVLEATSEPSNLCSHVQSMWSWCWKLKNLLKHRSTVFQYKTKEKWIIQLKPIWKIVKLDHFPRYPG